ncbi:MAG TPA: prepilin-type N-terminal cleavage/methylation domain-containing protein [Candidatus Acidoferrales bacterium]|nr:prepilin-type N-terminal cleavage/methylation domain-containing protein [Candidatus Acidoferrales bacterium]
MNFTDWILISALLTIVALFLIFLAGAAIERRRYRRVVRGFSLLEMLICLFIIEAVACMALPNAKTLSAYMARNGALQRVTTVRNAAGALAVCAAQQTLCPGVAPLIPAPGVLQTQSYTYTFAGDSGAWNYTANPKVMPNRSFYADQTGLIRFSDTGVAGSNSQILQ